MFDTFWKAVGDRLGADVQGWGLSNRYECRDWKNSHEGLVAEGVEVAGFRWEEDHFKKTRQHADGVVSHSQFPGQMLQYELKSIYIPHYTSAHHAHNQDFERLLRLGHKNGALGDVVRLRNPEVADDHRILLVCGVSWCDTSSHADLPEYERHRGILLDAFASLACLPVATKQRSIRTTNPVLYPWSVDLRAWVL